MTTRLALLATVASAAVGLLAASPSGAAVPTPVTLHESITFGGGHTPPVGVFTAEGLPQCSSGTFGDHLVNFNFGGRLLVVDRSYACEGRTGSFIARMALHIVPPDEDGVARISGEWTILDASGALAGLHGTGTTNGVNSGCAPIGSYFANCQTGVSTVAASIN
jgi:hypothetical protein